MPQCLKCGAELQVNEEGIAPVLCDRCAGVATRRARVGMNTSTMRQYPATTALAAIDIVIFILMVLSSGSLIEFSGQTLVNWGGNYGPWTLTGDYWRLVTAGFVHGGLIHIAFNMWCLWYVGQLAERLFGSWITVAVYVLTGVGGSMLSTWWDPTRLEIGASGAIFGIAGAILSGIKFGNVSVSAAQRRAIFSSLLFFIIFNFAFGLSPGVDNMCHLGGFITGLIFGVPLATASASGKKSLEWATIILSALVLASIGAQMVKAKRPPVGQVGHSMIIRYRNGNHPPGAWQDQLAEANGIAGPRLFTLASDVGPRREESDSSRLKVRSSIPATGRSA